MDFRLIYPTFAQTDILDYEKIAAIHDLSGYGRAS